MRMMLMRMRMMRMRTSIRLGLGLRHGCYMWLPLDTVFAGNACCLEKGDGSALKQLLFLECNKILYYVKGGGPPPKPCRYIWALDSDIDFTGVSRSGGPHWNRAQKSWALFFFWRSPTIFQVSKLPLFSVQTVQKATYNKQNYPGRQHMTRGVSCITSEEILEFSARCRSHHLVFLSKILGFLNCGSNLCRSGGG